MMDYQAGDVAQLSVLQGQVCITNFYGKFKKTSAGLRKRAVEDSL